MEWYWILCAIRLSEVAMRPLDDKVVTSLPKSVTGLSAIAMEAGLTYSHTLHKVGVPAMHKSSMDRARSFGSRASLDFEARGHSTHASIKNYSEFTLPHPLLRSRSPFALPPRDHTPSTERAAQVYSARAVRYDEGSRTGPQFAIHHKGWGRPCSTGVGESGKLKVPSWAHHSSSSSLPPGAHTVGSGRRSARWQKGHRSQPKERIEAQASASARVSDSEPFNARREADPALAAAEALVRPRSAGK